MGYFGEKWRDAKTKYNRNASYRKIRKEEKAKASEEGGEGSNKSADFDMANLAKPEFIAFMQRTFGDIHSLDPDKEADNKVLKERWDAFEDRNEVATGLNEIYKDTFTGLAEVDAQLRMDKIGAYLEDILENNPGKLSQLKKRVEEFKKAQTAVNNGKWKTRLEGKGDKKVDENEKMRLLVKAQGGKNVISRLFFKSDKLAVQRLKEEFGVQFDDIDNQLASMGEALPAKAKSEIDFTINKAVFNEARKKLMGEMTLTSEMGRMALTNLTERLPWLQADLKDKSVEELQKQFTEAQGILKDGDGRNLILEGGSKDEIEEFQKYMGNFDKAIQEKFMAELSDAIANNEKDELSKNLAPFLKKGALGSKNQMQIRQDVRKAIEDAARTVADPEKKYLLTAILATNKYLIA